MNYIFDFSHACQWVANPICMFTSHYSPRRKTWGSYRPLCSFELLSPCTREHVTHAFWWEQQRLSDLSAFDCFGRMVSQSLAMLQLAAQILPFKYLVNSEAHCHPYSKASSCATKKSIFVDHCTFTWPSNRAVAPWTCVHLFFCMSDWIWFVCEWSASWRNTNQGVPIPH